VADDYAIKAEGIGKRFLLHHHKATSVKERLLQTRGSSADEFWALRDVNLEIGHGETVGLIGPNGSGKSTLLKVLAGILEPTKGKRDVRGRIASLLELGAGFDGELTGRENVYLNASILGLSKKETDRYFDDIVEFSELGPFIDNQVKHYSSGMYVRLGFAVAVHVDPDILLIDEVLAVGDEKFAAKCLDKIAEFQDRGKTILFVTHGLDMIARICSRAVILNLGKLIFDGDPQDATDRLRALMGTAEQQVGDEEPAALRILDARVSNPESREQEQDFLVGDPMAIEVDLDVDEGAPPCELRVVVTGPADYPMYAMQTEPVPLDPGAKIQTVRLTIPSMPKLQGVFSLAVAVMRPGTRDALDARRFGERIRVFGPLDYGLVGTSFSVDVLDTPPPPAPPLDFHADHDDIKSRLERRAAARAAAGGGANGAARLVDRQ
jgi:ABC-2 type transport system ATP-binding protein